MAEIETASYAFYGNGEVDEKNAAALLDDYLPDKIGGVYRPARVPRANRSLNAVINWLESDDILGPKGTIPSDDLIASLLAQREEGDRVELIVLWPAEPGEEDLELARTAITHEIPVKNLSAALDDMVLEEETAPEPEVEEASAAETVAVAADIISVMANDSADALLMALRAFVTDVVQELLEARGITARPAASVAAKADVEKVAARLAGGTKTPREISDDVPFNGPYVDEAAKKYAYYVNADGEYRKAKARPRRGEDRAELTMAEIDGLVESGKLPASEKP